MKVKVSVKLGFEFKHEFSKHMVICYDIYHDKYWCKYETNYGSQFQWVSAKQIVKAIQQKYTEQNVVIYYEG